MISEIIPFLYLQEKIAAYLLMIRLRIILVY